MTKGGLDCGWSTRVAHVERGKSRRGKRQRTGVSSFPVSLMRNKDALPKPFLIHIPLELYMCLILRLPNSMSLRSLISRGQNHIGSRCSPISEPFQQESSLRSQDKNKEQPGTTFGCMHCAIIFYAKISSKKMHNLRQIRQTISSWVSGK